MLRKLTLLLILAAGLWAAGCGTETGALNGGGVNPGGGGAQARTGTVVLNLIAPRIAAEQLKDGAPPVNPTSATATGFDSGGTQNYTSAATITGNTVTLQNVPVTTTRIAVSIFVNGVEVARGESPVTVQEGQTTTIPNFAFTRLGQPVSLTITGDNTVAVNATIQMLASATYDTGGIFLVTDEAGAVWAVSSPNGAITQQGVLTGVNPGTVNVTATYQSGATLVSAAPFPVTVTGTTPTQFVSIEVQEQEVMRVGQVRKLNVFGILPNNGGKVPINAQCNFASSSGNVAVDNANDKGRLDGISLGSSVITCTLQGTSLSDTCNAHVINPLIGVSEGTQNKAGQYSFTGSAFAPRNDFSTSGEACGYALTAANANFFAAHANQTMYVGEYDAGTDCFVRTTSVSNPLLSGVTFISQMGTGTNFYSWSNSNRRLVLYNYNTETNQLIVNRIVNLIGTTASFSGELPCDGSGSNAYGYDFNSSSLFCLRPSAFLDSLQSNVSNFAASDIPYTGIQLFNGQTALRTGAFTFPTGTIAQGLTCSENIVYLSDVVLPFTTPSNLYGFNIGGDGVLTQFFTQPITGASFLQKLLAVPGLLFGSSVNFGSVPPQGQITLISLNSNGSPGNVVHLVTEPNFGIGYAANQNANGGTLYGLFSGAAYSLKSYSYLNATLPAITEIGTINVSTGSINPTTLR